LTDPPLEEGRAISPDSYRLKYRSKGGALDACGWRILRHILWYILRHILWYILRHILWYILWHITWRMMWR
jgi:hypothetical protein